jgi:capsular polysaccharide transport system permease protein
VLPISVLVVYQYLIASDRYESTASVYITEEHAQSSPFDLSLLGVAGVGSAREILVLKAFIESPTLMDLLDKDIQLLDHFSSGNADFFSRLSSGAPREDALDYYNNRVTSVLDEDAQLLYISVQTFDAAYSKQVMDRILFHSQQFIDALNENITGAQKIFFEAAVKRSEDDLLETNKILRDFQQKNKIFSTELTSQAIGETIAALEQQLAEKQAILRAREGTLNADAPRVVRIRAEIQALEEQIAGENERLAGKDGTSLSELDSRFRDIKLQIEYKTLRYKAHLEAFEQAQLDTARRLKFLTVVSAPTLPEASLYPRRHYIVFTGALVALMVYFLVAISLAIFKEHA